MTVHTIWVPEGWSVEQTWEAIKRGDLIPTYVLAIGQWVNVDENGREVVPDE